jgi:ATP citrate (pro-S)-lyase
MLQRVNPIHKKTVSKQTLSISPARRHSLFSTRTVVRTPKKDDKKTYTLSRAFLFALLAHEVKDTTAALGETIFRILIDHGGHVSGAINSMIAARAGKDIVSSLASGILTVGPRFGGAINSAAAQWLEVVESGEKPEHFVERHAKAGVMLSGIGHKKYRVGMPDPRVSDIAQFTKKLKVHAYTDFARKVEKITTTKSGSLILNVDGVIAAVVLDVLKNIEGYDVSELRKLIQQEFFNALFVIPRSVGFLGHILEQKRNDEGLLRLPDDLLFTHE